MVGKNKKGRVSAPTQYTEVMTFRPTLDEFSNFSKYVAYMETLGAHKAGIAKVVAPKGWVPRKGGYDVSKMTIQVPAPLKQKITTASYDGAHHVQSITKQPMSIQEYAALADSPEYSPPMNDGTDDLEHKYWKSLSLVDNPNPISTPIYAADIEDTVTDPHIKDWNVAQLRSILDTELDEKIPGVNTPYLYFGMWKSTFSWHVEDMDLYGINYLHFGAPKTWYCVPPQYGHLLEQCAQQIYPYKHSWCSSFLRHKSCIFSPKVMEDFGVPFHRVLQEERNFIIVFPYAYHSGFNLGFNCAEATNFALPRWVEYGKRYRPCDCSLIKNVNFSMEPFIKKFQPKRYEAWLKDEDYGPHPEDAEEVKAFFEESQQDEYLTNFLMSVMNSEQKIPDQFLQSYWGYDSRQNKHRDRKDGAMLSLITYKTVKSGPVEGGLSFTCAYRNDKLVKPIGKLKEKHREVLEKYTMDDLIKKKLVIEILKLIVRHKIEKSEMLAETLPIKSVIAEPTIDNNNTEVQDSKVLEVYETCDFEDPVEFTVVKGSYRICGYKPQKLKDLLKETTFEKLLLEDKVIKVGERCLDATFSTIEFYETKDGFQIPCDKKTKKLANPVAKNDQVKEAMDGKTIRKMVKEGTLKKVSEKVKSEYKHRLPMNPKIVAKNTWYKTWDGCVFSLRTEKNLQSRFLETLGRKKYDEIQDALSQNTVDDLLARGYLQLLGENQPHLIEDLIDVVVYKAPKGSEVYVNKKTDQIIPTSEQNKELFNLLKTSTLQKLITFKKLVKSREEKMANPSQGKEDPYMRRNKIKFAKFYTKQNSEGVVIFVDRFKKLLSSEQNWQQSSVDYAVIQKILDSKTIDKLLSEKYLMTEEDRTISINSEVQKLCDPSLTSSITNFKTKKGTKLRINKHKQIQKGGFQQKGVDYSEIQKVLNDNTIKKLIKEGYLKEVEEAPAKETEPELLQSEESYKYEGQFFVLTDKKKITQCKGKEAENLKDEFQKLLDTKSLEDLLYNGVVRKFYVRNSTRKAALTDAYRTTDKLEYCLLFTINCETQYLYGRTSELAIELFKNTSLEKLLDEGKIEKVKKYTEKQSTENGQEVTKRKQIKTQCWVNPNGERVFINVETLQAHGRVNKNIKELMLAGETLKDMIRSGYLQRLITPGEIDEHDEKEAKETEQRIKQLNKRKHASPEKTSPKLARFSERSRKTIENKGKDISNVTCRCAGSYGNSGGSSGKGRKRRQKCGKCLGCTKPDCGTCYHCKDMIKFGGAGTMKQRCMYKFCENPRLPNCPCFANAK